MSLCIVFYIICFMNAEDLIYPRSRFQVLRTLNYSETPISLHEIVDRSGLVVGSVQSALSWLLEAKVISTQKLNNRRCFRIKNKSVIEIVSKLQNVLAPMELQERAKQYQNRARNLLEDIEDRVRIIHKARSSMKL